MAGDRRKTGEFISHLKDIIAYQRDLITLYQAGEVLRRLERRLEKRIERNK